MRKRNSIGTSKIQVSVDRTTESVLNELVSIGIRGKNKSEVAYGIIREWIWHNQDQLKHSGISVVSEVKLRK